MRNINEPEHFDSHDFLKDEQIVMRVQFDMKSTG